MRPFLSICIPSYNRCFELKRLLDSIDTKYTDEIEIVVREDKSPSRLQIREMITAYQEDCKYHITYIENEDNYGYDKNIRMIAKTASGKWIIYMGDDDIFVSNSLDKYINFLKENDQLGYILRRYRANYLDGTVEEYRFANSNIFKKAGQESVVDFFRRSVFISGFTFKKELFNDYDCDEYDGTLLFQLYIQATICLEHPSAYCDIPITESIEGGIPYFGNSSAEKNLYKSGSITFSNSINFLKQVRILSESFDRKNNTNITDFVMKEYSKYSYGYLHEHRDDGIKVFIEYAAAIKKIGLGDSFYFYIYFFMLLILGRNNCRVVIRNIKNFLGHTPKL